jgi:hypothetical protein
MSDTLWVRSGLAGEFAEKVALWEWNDLHPNGDAFVAGSDSPPVEVGRSAKVMSYLHDGRLKEAKPGDLEKWRADREEKRIQALLDDAAMFPGAQRGDLSNRIAALEGQIASLQTAPRRGRPPNAVREG